MGLPPVGKILELLIWVMQNYGEIAKLIGELMDLIGPKLDDFKSIFAGSPA